MLRDIRRAVGAGGAAPVVVKEHLLMVTLNVVSRMVLGKKCVGEQQGSGAPAATPEEFRWMIEEIFFLNSALHIGYIVPVARLVRPQRVHPPNEVAGQDVRPIRRARPVRA